MDENYLICRKEMADMGYYFLDREQEDQYLKSINDEFALRVGHEITRRIPEDKMNYILSLPRDEMLDCLKNEVPDMEETIREIRRFILKEIEERRKLILRPS